MLWIFYFYPRRSPCDANISYSVLTKYAMRRKILTDNRFSDVGDILSVAIGI